MYSTLQGAGVREGIPEVHGLFEDPETGVAMLLMADLGRQTLQDRKHKEGDRFPRITEDELYVFNHFDCSKLQLNIIL